MSSAWDSLSYILPQHFKMTKQPLDYKSKNIKKQQRKGLKVMAKPNKRLEAINNYGKFEVFQVRLGC